MLLYRLLIEIRRVKNGSGSVGDDINANNYEINGRNKNRYLELEWRDLNCFNKDNNRLGFCTDVVALQSITEDVKEGSVLILPYCSWYASYADISIFHELCHWFHFLRNPNRYLLERTAWNNTVLINGETYDKTLKNSLAQYIYGDAYTSDSEKEKRWRISALPWREGEHVHFEELRNIIGAVEAVGNYLEGDDLSENLYRLSIGHPLRFGHSNEIYRESEAIVNKAKDIVINNARVFGLIILNLTVPGIFSTFVRVPTLDLKGLDNCKYHRNDLLYKSDLIFPKSR